MDSKYELHFPSKSHHESGQKDPSETIFLSWWGSLYASTIVGGAVKCMCIIKMAPMQRMHFPQLKQRRPRMHEFFQLFSSAILPQYPPIVKQTQWKMDADVFPIDRIKHKGLPLLCLTAGVQMLRSSSHFLRAANGTSKVRPRYDHATGCSAGSKGMSYQRLRNWSLTLPEINMETQNYGLESVSSLKYGHFRYLC